MSYQELTTKEEIDAALALVDSWKDPEIPERQWKTNVADFNKMYRQHGWLDVPPFRAFVEILRRSEYDWQDPKIELLDVGCSSGYYSEVMKNSGSRWNYTGVDYSPAFKEFAAKMFPQAKVDVGDAIALPYQDATFDVVVSGCCMIHMRDWKKAIPEAVRVSRRYVMFHRTPLLRTRPTTFWKKEAYGVPCVEIWFGYEEFMLEVRNAGLRVLGFETVFSTEDHGGYGHFSILTERVR